MELEVGMYVRTKKGKIRKIISLSFESTWKSVFVETHTWLKEEYILKASFDVIDLIEVGDYVNGYKVLNIYKNIKGQKTLLLNCEYKAKDEYSLPYQIPCVIDKNIKSIVTKEQFERISYKVGE